MAIVFVLLPEAERTEARQHHYGYIECDAEGCTERSPPSAEVVAKGGLSQMGWFIAGGVHRCPDHYSDNTPPSGPIYRDA
jgi:hypothetical protein